MFIKLEGIKAIERDLTVNKIPLKAISMRIIYNIATFQGAVVYSIHLGVYSYINALVNNR